MSNVGRPWTRRMSKTRWTVKGWVISVPRETQTMDHELGKRSFM